MIIYKLSTGLVGRLQPRRGQDHLRLGGQERPGVRRRLLVAAPSRIISNTSL